MTDNYRPAFLRVEHSPKYEHYFVVRAYIDENDYVHCILDSATTPPSNGKVVFNNNEGKWIAPVDDNRVLDDDKRIHTHLHWCLEQNNFSQSSPEPF